MHSLVHFPYFIQILTGGMEEKVWDVAYSDFVWEPSLVSVFENINIVFTGIGMSFPHTENYRIVTYNDLDNDEIYLDTLQLTSHNSRDGKIYRQIETCMVVTSIDSF